MIMRGHAMENNLCPLLLRVRGLSDTSYRMMAKARTLSANDCLVHMLRTLNLRRSQFKVSPRMYQEEKCKNINGH